MREIDVAQLEVALRQGAALIDVREPAEYGDGHVPGAHPIPMGRLSDRLDELDKSAPVHVICASGGRSSAMRNPSAAFTVLVLVVAFYTAARALPALF